MQNRYVGDIGDYVKLAILRALSPGYHVGVAWWLFPDEGHNKDGRHIGYLDRPDHWRQFDPDLFDTLAKVVSSGQRDVRALEAANILPGAIFASDTKPVGKSIADRPHQRRLWFATVEQTLAGADFVFVDPDNGLEPYGLQARLGQGWREHHAHRATGTGTTRTLPDRLSSSDPPCRWASW